MKSSIFKLWIIIIGDKSFTRIIGILLLIPPILSVFFFLLSAFGLDCDLIQFENLSEVWRGGYEVCFAPEYSSKAGGFAGGAGYNHLCRFI